MDLIERIFGMSPDHGSGALEAVCLVAALVIPIAVTVLRVFRRRSFATRGVSE